MYKNIILSLNYVGRLLSAISTFYLLPTFLTLDQHGLYTGIHHIVFLLARIDLSQAIIRYGSRLHNNPQKKNAFLSFAITATTTLYAFILLLCFLSKTFLIPYLTHKVPELITYLPLIITLAYIVLLNVTLKAWYIAQRAVLWPSITQHVLLNTFMITLTIGFSKGYYSFPQLLWATIIPYTLNLTLLTIGLWRRGELTLTWDPQLFKAPFLRPFTSYALFTLFTGSLSMLMIRLDNVMVLSLRGKVAEVLYHTTTFLILLLEIPFKVVKQTSASHIATLLHHNDKKPLQSLYQQQTVWQLATTSACFLSLYALLDYLLYAFPSHKIPLIKQLFLLLGTTKLIDNIFRIASEILLYSRFYLWSWVGAALLIIGAFGNAYMIPLMGPAGASIMTSIILLLSGTISALLVHHKLRIHPFSLPLLYWTLTATLSLITILFIPSLTQHPTLPQILTITLTYTLTYHLLKPHKNQIL